MTYHSTTTLNEIRAARPCKDGYEKLLAYLGKTKADYEPLPLLTILDSNGLDDALWCLRTPSLERLSRHFHAWCAEQVLPIFEREHPDDPRIRDQIAMLRNDNATLKERKAARAAAWAAAWAAARDATWAAAQEAAQEAAWAAAWAAARDAQEHQLRMMIEGTA